VLCAECAPATGTRHRLDSWVDLPINQEPAPNHLVADLLEFILSFLVGAVVGGVLGFAFWARAVMRQEFVEGARSMTAGWFFVVGCALVGGLWLAIEKPTLR